MNNTVQAMYGVATKGSNTVQAMYGVATKGSNTVHCAVR